MKRFFEKITLFILGVIALLGLNLKDSKAVHSSYLTQITPDTPLFLQHANDIFQNQDVLSWHYSHFSHRSHYSHESHFSHYSHYSSRW